MVTELWRSGQVWRSSDMSASRTSKDWWNTHVIVTVPRYLDVYLHHTFIWTCMFEALTFRLLSQRYIIYGLWECLQQFFEFPCGTICFTLIIEQSGLVDFYWVTTLFSHFSHFWCFPHFFDKSTLGDTSSEYYVLSCIYRSREGW